MHIREVKLNDLSAIARVNVDTFAQTQQGFIPDSLIRGLSYNKAEERFKRMLSKTERLSTIFVAENDGDVIGYAMCGLAREKVLHYEGELYGIYILPEYHSQGVGRQLMVSTARHLNKQGVASMFVAVFTDNIVGRKFYEALGGQWIEERVIELGGEHVSQTLYGWDSLNSFMAAT